MKGGVPLMNELEIIKGKLENEIDVVQLELAHGSAKSYDGIKSFVGQLRPRH